MKFLKSERGVTLVELMLVVLVGGMVVVMAMGVLLNTSGTSSMFGQSIDVEIDELNASVTLQQVFGQSLQVKYKGNVDLNSHISVGNGELREFDSDALFSLSPTVPTTHTVAFFMRDSQQSTMTSVGTLTSNVVPTGIFFQTPTAKTWGVLYVNGNGQPTLSPSRSNQIFEGITRFRVFNINTYSPLSSALTLDAPVTGFDLEITFRRFIGDVKPEARLFCPASAITTVPGCNAVGAHRDVSRVFRVLLRNNILDTSPNSPPSPAQPVGARVYDLVHFFTLGRDGNSL